MPRLSVCITHYNRPEKLGATLASLAAQTRIPDEVFLWDDCSPNDPSEIARQWAGRFPHFVYHRNEVNLGMPGNLNAVVGQATGDYVANLHDADIFSPTLLEKWEAALEANPEAALVFCRDSRWNNQRFVTSWGEGPAAFTYGKTFFERYYLGRLDSLIWGTVMVRRSVYLELLPFDSRFKNWADVDMWMRVCGLGGIAFVDQFLITLDDSPTPLRQFSFSKNALLQRMVITNIQRLLTGGEVHAALVRQRHTWRRKWLRWMFAGALRGDRQRMQEGIRYYRDNFLLS